MSSTKPIHLSKSVVMQAYKLVKSNAGAAGVDQQTLDDFDQKLGKNLYKIWNRLSSGSYFPPAVKQVGTPKKSGGTLQHLARLIKLWVYSCDQICCGR